MKKIDSHQHFWKYDSQKQSWIDDEMAVIRRNFLPEDIKKEFNKNQIEGCVAVQADQSLEENNFLLNLSREHSFIKAIVGWVDFRSVDLIEQLEKYAEEPVVKGFRHIVQGEKDPNFLLRSNFLKGISSLKQFDFTYDILVFPHQLGAVLEFVKKNPNQKFIIDHIAKPYIRDGFFEGWAVLIREIGACQNVYCKISGMVTEADYTLWNYSQLLPYLDVILESFGTKRICFGSDWPVCLVAADYSEVVTVAKNFASGLSVSEQEDFWANNAIRFYNF
jgi:L-fuconolactonase